MEAAELRSLLGHILPPATGLVISLKEKNDIRAKDPQPEVCKYQLGLRHPFRVSSSTGSCWLVLGELDCVRDLTSDI